MSSNSNDTTTLDGSDCLTLSDEQLVSKFSETLERGVHGICFSPYQNDQKPGSQISEAQIQNRIEVLKPYSNWIRTFSCTEGNEQIPRIAKENGLKTLVGAWLGKDDQRNQIEIAKVIEIARAGYADIVAVGNEVLYRKEMDESQLIPLIQKTRDALPNVPVGYVDAYYEYVNRPALTEACDILLANCYPFWEGCQSEYSLLYMKEMYRQATRAAKGKKVIITESGWPSNGTACKKAIPSARNAMSYFINAQKWSHEEKIELFYFSSFDESWKTSVEGDVGAYWGIWDTEGNLKYQTGPAVKSYSTSISNTA